MARLEKKAASFGEQRKVFNFSFVMNIISKDLDIDKNIRGFEFSESSRHLSNQMKNLTWTH